MGPQYWASCRFLPLHCIEHCMEPRCRLLWATRSWRSWARAPECRAPVGHQNWSSQRKAHRCLRPKEPGEEEGGWLGGWPKKRLLLAPRPSLTKGRNERGNVREVGAADRESDADAATRRTGRLGQCGLVGWWWRSGGGSCGASGGKQRKSHGKSAGMRIIRYRHGHTRGCICVAVTSHRTGSGTRAGTRDPEKTKFVRPCDCVSVERVM